MIFLTSDLHLGDKHYLKKVNEIYDLGLDPKTHCKMLIQNFNDVLHRDDKLYILGDISIGKLSKEIFKFFYNVKCKKILIAGNHDSWQVTKQLLALNLISEVHGCLEMDGFILTHVPVVTTEINGIDRRYYKGNIHGHIHDEAKNAVLDQSLYYNVCANLNGFKPVSFEEIKNKLTK